MSSKRIAIYVVLVLAVLVVLVTVRSRLVVLVSALVAAAVAFAVSRAQGDGSAERAQEGAESSEALPEWVDHLRELVKLDATLREHACPEAVIGKLEEIIDVLRRLLPELNESHVGSELTWTVNRMATDYLSRIVAPYVELAPGARAEHEEEFLKSLVGLEAELENIEGLVRTSKVGDFQAKAAFLRARFLEDKL